MKIYRTDGTWYSSKFSDDDFGWNLDDLEDIWLHEEQGKEKIAYAQNLKNLKQLYLACKEDLRISEIVDINTPRKSQLINLINPCTVESKILLSVLNHAMFKKLNSKMIKTEYFIQSNAYRMYTKRTNNFIVDGIANYNHYKNENDFSLLVDMVLSENDCDINAISSEKEILPEISKSDVERTKEVLQKCFQCKEIGTESHVYEAIFEQIVKLLTEVETMHRQISELRSAIQEETIRVDGLIESAQNMEKDLRETKFLDDFINLLKGKLEKVMSKNPKFRIFLQFPEEDNLNLII